MADERFDVIVVGGGLAGISAAYVMAAQGLEVLLIERGNDCGAKNMTGGRIYGHSLAKIIPDFAQTAPLERRIVKERLSIREDGKYVTAECRSADIQVPEGESYAVLRAHFDKWFAGQAEEAGVMLINGIRVDDLIVRDGVVCGVVAGEEEMEADVVILADGVNSLLAQKIGMKPEPEPSWVSTGVKELIEIGETAVNERFGLASGEGLAWMLLDEAGGGVEGFLYPNKSSVSIGITIKCSEIGAQPDSVAQLFEDFKQQPEIAELIRDGKLLEYSAHLVPDGGAAAIPRLSGDGVLIVGDAAGLTANLGFTLRGMDLAIESGRLAGETVLAANEKGDFSEASLSAYQTALADSFVMSCMKGAETCAKTIRTGGLQEDLAKQINRAMAAILT